ncbi:acyl carrier protein [Listeria monocytogenes]|nr:acyl carrier protein [Listeria monocytogenes]EGT8066448.1 acyl carrier protein [Listeria monocytogenes]EHP2991537.1 acyl carrier protein [Listeria monocytogenes]
MNSELQEILRDNGMFISSEDLNIKLDFDSVKFMEVLIDIETTFKIVIPDNELINLDTVADLNELIKKGLIQNG